MTTVTQIIDDAFRASNITGTGRSPTEAEQTEALRYLSRIVQSTMGNEAGDDFTNIPIGSENISRPSGYPWYNTVPDDQDWFVNENFRLMVNISEPQEVYLHPDPDDGARFAVIDMGNNLSTANVTVVGNGRHIDGQDSLVIDEDGFIGEWFYRADLGSWMRYQELALEDEFPFPVEFDDFFILTLAMRINPGYGKQMDAQSAQIMQRAKRQLQSRYNVVTPMPVEDALLRMSKMTADRERWQTSRGFYSPNRAFDRGRPY